MNRLLRQWKFVDSFVLTLNINHVNFRKQLVKAVEKESFLFFFDPFNLLSSKKKKFLGNVNNNSFVIRRKHRFVDSFGHAVAKGKFNEDKNQLFIEVEIIGLNLFKFLSFIFYFIAYLFILIIILTDDKIEGAFSIMILSFFGLITFIIPIYVIKESVKRLKTELSQEILAMNKI